MSGRPATYGAVGTGPPVVFLHGWALGHHSYAGALERLAARGFEVVMPALPGFGGTPELAEEDRSFAGYARFVGALLEGIGMAGPLTLVGHSFGGAVAIRLAHDRPERVSGLVLLNAIGAPRWYVDGGVAHTLSERPLRNWIRRLNGEVMPHALRMIPSMTADLFPNAFLRPGALWRTGELARHADLRTELARLGRSDLPVAAVWSEDDHVIPRASFNELCASLGRGGVVVPGRHSWPFADPDAFADLVERFVVDSGQGQWSRQGSRAG